MSQTTSQVRHPRIAALALLLVAPFVGEFVLGNISITAEWPALIVLAPLYGGGALLIREVSRRAGRGWPSIIAFGIAYGTIEAGVLDQTLFSPPDVAGVTAELLFVPALGFDLANYVVFVGGHVVWSLWIPIIIVETLAGRTEAEQRTPWLGRRGLVATGLLYLAGCAILLWYTVSHDLAAVTGPQAVGVVTVAVIMVVVGLVVRPPRPDTTPPRAVRRVPGPGWLAPLGLVAGTVAFLAPEGIWTLVVRLVVAALLIALVGRWSRRPEWTPAHRAALAAGGLLVFTYSGFVLTDLYGRTGTAVWVGQAVVAAVSVLGVVALLVRYRRPGVGGQAMRDLSAERDMVTSGRSSDPSEGSHPEHEPREQAERSS